MLKILNFPKKGLKQMLTWLWKTFFYSIISLYRLVRKISFNDLFYQKYLISPAVIISLIILTLVETVWAINGDDTVEKMILLKIDKSKEEVMIEDTITNQNNKFDFTIASTKDTSINFTEPAVALGGEALVNPDSIPNETPILRTGIETYIVQVGDTLESIAKKFAISIETICWENKLSVNSVLKPGQELKILPVSGLTHKVLAGDTLDAISLKYKTSIEDIIDFNNLADPSDIFVGDILIIPFGKKPPPPKPAPTPPARQKVLFVNENYSDYREWLKKTQCHRFINGQCTSWVAFKWATILGRCITWTGHAKSWLSAAKSAGFRTGSRSDGPATGAIIVLKESGWAARRFGHVAYVESFDDQNVTFSEMNFKGPWNITQRSYPRDSSQILGYIYAN